MGEKKKGGRNKKGGREGKLLESQGDANSVLVAVLSCSVMSSSLLPHGLQPSRFLCPWTSPGKNTEVDSHSLLQWIFPIQRSTLSLLHYRQILYQLSHHGSPKEEGQMISNGKRLHRNI